METKTINMQIVAKIINGELPKLRAKELLAFCRTQDDKEIVLSVAKGHTHPEILNEIFLNKK